VLRAENGEVRKWLDSAALDIVSRKSKKFNLDVHTLNVCRSRDTYALSNKADQEPSPNEPFLAELEAQMDLEKDSAGVAWLIGLLSAAEERVR